MQIKRPKKGEWIERIYDQVKAVEDFESRPHKAVSFVVERDKEVQAARKELAGRSLAKRYLS